MEYFRQSSRGTSPYLSSPSQQYEEITYSTYDTNPEVLCDICDDGNTTALKSCLVCLASFCETHLEPHQRVPNFKRHRLIVPVNNIKDYICPKHSRALEMFCRYDQMSICGFCTEGYHKTHNIVSLEEESEERKIQMRKAQKDLKAMIQEKQQRIKYIEHSSQIRKENIEGEKASIMMLFSNLIQSVEKCQTELLDTMDQDLEVAEEQDEELIRALNQEIIVLKKRNIQLENLSNTEDVIRVIQTHPSICSPPESRNCPEIGLRKDMSVETLGKAISNLQQTLNEILCQPVFERVQKHAVKVTLDPDTAHPKLILSQDGQQVRVGEVVRKIPNNIERFDESICVLGKEGFLSGRFYFEVQVKEKTEWDVGVARESVNRKGKIKLKPQEGFWTIALRDENKYWALNDHPVALSLKLKLEKLGVFVDYEEGLVSFYNAASRSHIYSFTDQTFINRLYPYFCPFPNNTRSNFAPINILPVSFTESF
ncbi:hypothetical protein DNTS_010049 [Danionella cerebrum]|uniref:B30.2/SPRY domain-containing protein n=1 Tax=Danionella cerebrum TaxID=2873325 RepID=A0A553N391_9TELE|nr:hypothetical protein DNTS_010049 [Danionella translucida]TRY59907.1 hypothetical protein DNTS_010049 [Danionella translucida]